METFLVLLGLLALIELGVALGWAQDSRDDRDRWPFHGDWRHDASNEPSGKDIPSTSTAVLGPRPVRGIRQRASNAIRQHARLGR